VAFRNGERLVARLAPAPPPTAAWEPRADARYLIIGGTGGLGFALARELAERGARHLVLTSRHGIDASDPAECRRRQEGLAGLAALGARVDVRACDAADETALAEILAESPPVRGVFHLAVDMSEAPLATMTPAALEAMLRPKAAAAWALHRATRETSLDAFVLFSSSTSLLGVSGLGHYAAANQFLDALAHWRRGRGLPALSVNWGIWEIMRLASATEQRRFVQAGLRPMATRTAVDALAALLGAGATQAMVASIEWPTLRAGYETRRRRPFLELLGAPAETEDASKRGVAKAEGGSALCARLAQVPAGNRREMLVGAVRAEAGRILGLDPARLDPERGLFELGMDSLMSVELKGRLERLVGRALPGTVTFNYPNVAALAGYLEGQLFPAGGVGSAVPLETAAVVSAAPETTDPARRDDMSEEDLAALLRKKLQQI
jgi:myxalamid-type polyketide synthase MxaE and MxaD